MPARVVFEPILPKRGLFFPNKQYQRFVALAEAEIRTTVKPKLKRLFQVRTAGWETRVDFAGRVQKGGGKIELLVFPRGAGRSIWQFVSDGTPPHAIRPRRAKVLRFPTRYSPHTRPSNVYGGPGTYGGPVVSARAVQHPGTQARNFEKHIADQFEREFQQRIVRVLRISTQ